MTSLSRDSRAVSEFAYEYATKHQLTAEQTEGLSRRTNALVDWLKQFRRTLGHIARYAIDHPQRRAALDELVRATSSYTSHFGPIEIRFRPGHSESAEGFPLPHAVEADLIAYTFYPMFRDGVARLLIAPGAGPDELDQLLQIANSRGRRDGDDVFTWIWRLRSPSIRIEAEPTLNAEVASALTSHGVEDPALQAFMATLDSADPFFSSADARPLFTTDTLDGLADQGIYAERAMRLLTTPEGAAEAPALDAGGAAALRSLLAHPGDREARIEAIRGRHFGGRGQ